MTSDIHSSERRRARRAASRTSSEQPVVLVAVCTGARCAALRRVHRANPASHGPSHPVADGAGLVTLESKPTSESEQSLRAAIRARREAVLVSVPCLGPCSHASVTAIGPGIAGSSQLAWLGRPTLIGLSESPARADALAQWITSSAPDPATLPAALRTDL